MTGTALKNGQVLGIRVAGVKDARRLVEHGNVVGGESDFLGYGKDQFPIPLEKLEMQLGLATGSKQNITIIGSILDEVVSVAGLFTSPGKRSHVADLGITVRQSCWNLGIGAAMLQYLVTWARATRVLRKIHLEVMVQNASAIRLYEKAGFAVEGTLRRALLKNGVFIDMLVMGLLID
jgi:RimJ/RimL family protein N-acetyltransferase